MQILRRLDVGAVRLARPDGRFAQLRRGSIRKPQHHLVEVLVELLAVTHNGQIVALLRRRRRDVQMPLALEYRPGHLAVHFTIKSKAAAAESEGRRVPAQLQVIDSNDFTARQKPAQLLVNCVAVAGVLGMEQGQAGQKEKNKNRETRTNSHRHRRAPSWIVFVTTV